MRRIGFIANTASRAAFLYRRFARIYADGLRLGFPRSVGICGDLRSLPRDWTQKRQMHEVFANTTPLQYLHRLDRLGWLRDFYGGIVVPEAVAAELSGPRKNPLAE